MRYDYNNEGRCRHHYEDIEMVVQAEEWNKNSPKEVLQYAVGGLLYMPASNTKIAKKIISGEYKFIKSMVLDLEDSLGDDLVGFGQRAIQTTMREIGEAVENGTITINEVPLIFIRVREKKHIQDAYTMLKSDMQYITGFNIPKFDKTTCDGYINTFKKVAEDVFNKYRAKLYMMPIIENKNTMYRQLRMDNLLYMNDKLRDIADNVLNIRVGGADFCQVYGIRRSMNDDIYDIGVVRSVLNDKRKNGKFVGSTPCYGYMRDPNDKGHLIPNPETAPIVKNIFKWRADGIGPTEIANKLNDAKILTPSAYKNINFSSRLIELSETIFEKEYVNQKIDEYVRLMDHPIENHYQRFFGTSNEKFYEGIEIITTFFNQRRVYVMNSIKNNFGEEYLGDIS